MTTTSPVTTPITTSGVPGITVGPSQPATTGGGGQTTTTSNGSVPTTYSPTPANATGGGFIDDLNDVAADAGKWVGQGLKGLLGYAGESIANARKGLEELLLKAKEGDPADPGEIAVAQSKIQEATLSMEMLAKAFEEERRAREIWLR